MLERWREFWRASEAELGPVERPSAKEILGIFMSAFVFYAVLTPRGLANGDAAVYAQQVLERDFASRPVHLGYYLLAALGSLGQPVPDRFFNLLSSFFAAATLAVALALARYWVSDARLAWSAPLALAAQPLFLENAVHAEVHAAQTFFLLLALFAWLREHPPAAGFCFGVAGLLTPSSVFFAPAFLVVKRPRLLPVALLAATAGITVLVPILPLRHEYFYGDRGLLTAAGKGLGLLQIFRKEGIELAGFLAFLPLLALGLYRAVRRPAARPLAAAVAAAWAASLLGEKFGDVPVQLPTWAFASVFAACGAAELAERLGRAAGRRSAENARRTVLALAGAALLLTAGVAGWRLAEKNRRIEDYRRQALALGQAARSDFLAIGSWERGILLEHYLFRRSYTEHVLNTAWLAGGWGADRQASAEATLAAAIAGGRQVWLLGPAPEPEARLLAAGYVIREDASRLRVAERAAPVGEGS